MNRKYTLRILGSVEELNSVNNNRTYKKLVTFQIDPFNYGLLVYTVEEWRISFLKLSVQEMINNEDNLELNSDDNSTDKEAFKISFLNVFSLPFILFKVICTSNNIWAIGQESVVDLKPYLKSALEKATFAEENDECMDVDDAEESHHEMFDIAINFHECEKCDFHPEDIFIGCSFIDYGLIQCQKNSTLNAWKLEIILLNDSNAGSLDVMTHTFLDFPVSFNKRDMTIDISQGQKDVCDPIVLFIYHSDPESHVFRDIFGVNCPSSNALCLIGHPDGKLLWSLCDCTNHFHSSLKLQILFDVKQPVVGIFFVKDIEELEGYDCMLVVGALGQLTLFSSKKHPSLDLVPGKHPFWITTTYLKSSITNCAIVKDCLFYFLSNETLWITDLSALLTSKKTSEELCLASNSSDLGIEHLIVVDKSQGLTLYPTSSGNIYLTVCERKLDAARSSLPSLMNDCLKQSTMMQELLHKKAMQSRFFATISAFASLKFCANALKESITFSLSEVNLEPRKYILIINYKCLEQLHLDTDLCYVTATVFTYFKRNFSLVTKTAPFTADQPTLCLELTDTVLQPPFVSIFPLFVEIGLVLQLPSIWKAIDCFKSLSSCLPFYLRVETILVHELHLLQSNTLCPAQSFRCEKPKTMKIIEELAMKRPISNILHMESRRSCQLPEKINLCLSISSLEEMMKNTGDSDPCEYIKKLLFGKKHFNNGIEETHSMSKKHPLSVEIVKNDSSVVLTLTANSFDSLIGLRIAVMDILLATHQKSKHLTYPSTYVSVPASIYRKCEDISKSLMSLYGKDVESDEVIDTVMQLYQELRRDVSSKLPIL